MIKVNIKDVKPNPKNPRVIRDNKFQKLVQSIKEFPDMLNKRPLIVFTDVDGKYCVLGGNMRLKALNELKYTEIPVIIADEWTEEQKAEFLIKDNVGFGEWDWDQLANEWDVQDLQDWGLEMPFIDNSSFEYLGKITDVESNEIEEIEQNVHNSLSDQFIVPPFSVFDTKQGYWQRRKAAWKNLGIQSEIGRNKNLLNYSETILQASTELSGTSVFDPVLCEISYKWFCKDEGTILDPFAGGSVRGVVASKVGRNYIGIDLRSEQIQANEKQVQELCESHLPKYIVGNSENLIELINSIDEQPKVDMIFTCPPYYDLEQYSVSDQDLSAMSYEEFDAAYESIIEQSIKLLSDDSFSVFVVGDVRDKNGVYLNLIGKTVEAHKKAGAVFYNSAILLESVGTAGLRAARIFNGGRKLCKVHQNILVFYKGNIANIKTKFGTIVSEIEEFETNNTEYGDKIELEVSI